MRSRSPAKCNAVSWPSNVKPSWPFSNESVGKQFSQKFCKVVYRKWWPWKVILVVFTDNCLVLRISCFFYIKNISHLNHEMSPCKGRSTIIIIFTYDNSYRKRGKGGWKIMINIITLTHDIVRGRSKSYDARNWNLPPPHHPNPPTPCPINLIWNVARRFGGR